LPKQRSCSCGPNALWPHFLPRMEKACRPLSLRHHPWNCPNLVPITNHGPVTGICTKTAEIAPALVPFAALPALSASMLARPNHQRLYRPITSAALPSEDESPNTAATAQPGAASSASDKPPVVSPKVAVPNGTGANSCRRHSPWCIVDTGWVFTLDHTPHGYHILQPLENNDQAFLLLVGTKRAYTRSERCRYFES
jgi:hypothetical protein